MILGLGLDLVSIPRIQKNIDRFGAHFLERILTPGELEILPRGREATYAAGRFAAKEAAVKAIGTGFSEGVGLKDLEILAQPNGQPRLHFRGEALRKTLAMGVRRISVSISHERELAVAVVILED